MHRGERYDIPDTATLELGAVFLCIGHPSTTVFCPLTRRSRVSVPISPEMSRRSYGRTLLQQHPCFA